MVLKITEEEQIPDNKWFVHYITQFDTNPKIFDSKTLKKIFKEQDYNYWNAGKKSLSIYKPGTKYNFAYQGPFDTLYDAKRFILTDRLRFIEYKILLIDLLQDKEINELIKKKVGYYKTKKALKRLEEVYPEFNL